MLTLLRFVVQVTTSEMAKTIQDYHTSIDQMDSPSHNKTLFNPKSHFHPQPPTPLLELILGHKHGDFGDVPSQLDSSLQLAHLHFCLQCGRALHRAHQHQLPCHTV